MRAKKAQAAMEYLMTYGWAILVAVIVFAALIFFGIFTIKNPEFCQMPPGTVCSKSYLSASTDKLSLTLYNSYPKEMVVVAVGCSKRANATITCAVDTCGADYNPPGSPGAIIGKGSSRVFNITCEEESGSVDFANGEGYGGNINVRYYLSNEPGNIRLITGRVYAIAN